MKTRLLFITLFSFLLLHTSATAQVVINEINYNSDASSDTEDWIEIYNNSSSNVNISEWKIKDSNDDNEFIFAASTVLNARAYLVIVRDLDDFKVVFPNVTNVVDSIDFNFSNAGELVRLYNSSDVLIDQVEYDDESPWPTEPDGDGPTLELKDPSLDNSLASSWGASSGFGTPGSQNSLLVSNEDEGISPNKFQLNQNYPNPFNPTTSISYSLANSGKVTLEVFNILGEKIASLVNETQTTGTYEVQFNASKIPSGIYMYQLTSGDKVTVRRMTLIK